MQRETSSTAVEKPNSGTYPVELEAPILREDLFADHLRLTAPDRDVFPTDEGVGISGGVLQLYCELNPRNPIEGMMATMLIAIFNASLGSIADGTRNDTPPHVRDVNLRHGFNGAKVFGDFLDRYQLMRGESQGTVRVGNVNVEAGGQAIVGNVQSALGPGRITRSKRPLVPRRGSEGVNLHRPEIVEV